MDRRVRLVAVAAFSVCFGCWLPAFADEPAGGAGATAAQPPLPGAEAGATSAPVSSDTGAGASSVTAPPVGAGADAASGLEPGPMLEQRKELLDHIHQASTHGIGTANYMMAFRAIEDQVHGGASEAQIRPRVESLGSSLIDQLKRAQILKVQHPLPPSQSQQPEAGGVATAPSAGAVGGLSPAVVDKIKSQLGGIDIPDSVRDKLMNNDKAREFLKRLGQ